MVLALGLAAGCKPARYEIVTNTSGGEPVKPVVEPNPNPDQNTPVDKPFRVEGPAKGVVGTPIKVVGIDCGPNNSGKITFMPLGTTQTPKNGPTAEFTFDRADTYTIEGTCEQDGKAPQKATVSVKIEPLPVAPGGQNGQNGQNQSGQNQSGQNP